MIQIALIRQRKTPAEAGAFLREGVSSRLLLLFLRSLLGGLLRRRGGSLGCALLGRGSLLFVAEDAVVVLPKFGGRSRTHDRSAHVVSPLSKSAKDEVRRNRRLDGAAIGVVRDWLERYSLGAWQILLMLTGTVKLPERCGWHFACVRFGVRLNLSESSGENSCFLVICVLWSYHLVSD